jgi:hypothetical protein
MVWFFQMLSWIAIAPTIKAFIDPWQTAALVSVVGRLGFDRDPSRRKLER